jgi:hypothetical protein
MEKVKSEIKIIREEKVDGIIMRAKSKWRVKKVHNIFVI